MEEFLKMTNINKYITAIKVANFLKNAVYITVAALSIMNIFRLYKAIVK